MNYSEAITALASYYREKVTQENFRIKAVKHWLETEIPERELGNFVASVMKQHETDFFPNIHVLQKIRHGSLDAKAEKAWIDISSMAPGQDIECHEPVIYAVLSSIGDWVDFHHRLETEPVWLKKEFIESFKKMAGIGLTETGIIRGSKGKYRPVKIDDNGETKLCIASIGTPTNRQIRMKKNQEVEKIKENVVKNLTG